MACNHTGKFPRNHRFVLGERIERNLYDLLEILIRAKYTRNRQELLEQANLVLEILRFQMRLAKDLQCLKVESYGFAARPSRKLLGVSKHSLARNILNPRPPGSPSAPLPLPSPLPDPPNSPASRTFPCCLVPPFPPWI